MLIEDSGYFAVWGGRDGTEGTISSAMQKKDEQVYNMKTGNGLDMVTGVLCYSLYISVV